MLLRVEEKIWVKGCRLEELNTLPNRMLAIPNTSDSDDSKTTPLTGEYDDSKVKVRVKAPDNLPAGFIFQATSHETSDSYVFDAQVVSCSAS